MQTTVDSTELKLLLKEAVVEVLEERRDLLQNVIEDALEEIALTRAIRAEEQSSAASRDEVFEALTSAA